MSPHAGQNCRIPRKSLTLSCRGRKSKNEKNGSDCTNHKAGCDARILILCSSELLLAVASAAYWYLANGWFDLTLTSLSN